MNALNQRIYFKFMNHVLWGALLLLFCYSLSLLTGCGSTTTENNNISTTQESPVTPTAENTDCPYPTNDFSNGGGGCAVHIDPSYGYNNTTLAVVAINDQDCDSLVKNGYDDWQGFEAAAIVDYLNQGLAAALEIEAPTIYIISQVSPFLFNYGWMQYQNNQWENQVIAWNPLFASSATKTLCFRYI